MNNIATEKQRYAIKDVSKLSGLPESTLRYYESIGLIDSIERDASSKHRTYGEDNITAIISIACLSATGMSIDDMRSYLRNRDRGVRSAKDQIALLKAQKQRLEAEEKYQKLRRRYLEAKIAYWQAVAAKDAKKMEAVRKTAESISKELRLSKERQVIN